ncbi:MAG: hypothetical protein P4L84_36035, partial [Isosphaeraceae bacterium]|nr:hypothetical protein [Isosphaeraceae bacterium]
ADKERVRAVLTRIIGAALDAEIGESDNEAEAVLAAAQAAEDAATTAAKAADGKPKLFNVYLEEPVEKLLLGHFIGHTHQHSADDALEYMRERYPKYRNVKLRAHHVQA